MADPHADWRPHRGPVPILEYHELGPAPAGAAYPELFVSNSDFRAEMNWLDRHGYEAVTLDEVEDAWYGGAPLAPKPVVLTFDDGYQPQYTFAMPLLHSHDWAGVLNLKAEGSDLYKKNVRAMIGEGWEVASHTVNHLDLTTLDPATLKSELVDSRKILREDFGGKVDNFCYPAGRFDQKVIAAVKAAGYRGATTEVRGYATRSDPYRLKRFEVLGSSGVDGVAAFLSDRNGA